MNFEKKLSINIVDFDYGDGYFNQEFSSKNEKLKEAKIITNGLAEKLFRDDEIGWIESKLKIFSDVYPQYHLRKSVSSDKLFHLYLEDAITKETFLALKIEKKVIDVSVWSDGKSECNIEWRYNSRAKQHLLHI
jgi:hypothetical protein